MQEIPADVLVAGNLGLIDINSRKIAHVEWRHVGRYDSDMVASLMQQKRFTKFIHKICVSR